MPLSSKLWKQVPVEKVRQYPVPEPSPSLPELPATPEQEEEPLAKPLPEQDEQEPVSSTPQPRHENGEKSLPDDNRQAAREAALNDRENQLHRNREQVHSQEKELEKRREELQQQEKLLNQHRELFAEEIVRRQEEEAEKGFREGYDRGYGEGAQKAEKENEGLLQDIFREREEAKEMLAGARRRFREIVASAEMEIVDIAMAVADKLLRGQLKNSPESVVGIVREALSALTEGEEIKIYVHPEDKVLCRDLFQDMQNGSHGLNSLEFIGESRIPRGSCRVESEKGSVSISLEEEQAQLRDLLTALARQERLKNLQTGDGT